MAALPGPSSGITFQPIELMDPKPEIITAGLKLESVNQIQNNILVDNKVVFKYKVPREDAYDFQCNYPGCYGNVKVYAGSSSTLYIQTSGHKCGDVFTTNHIWKSFPPGTKVMKMMLINPITGLVGFLPYLWVRDNIYCFTRTIYGIDEFECCCRRCEKVVRLFDWTNPFTKRRVKLVQELYVRNDIDKTFSPSLHQHFSIYDPASKLKKIASTLFDINLEDDTLFTAGEEDTSLDSKWNKASTSKTRKRNDYITKKLGVDYGASSEEINMDVHGYDPEKILDITKQRNKQLVFGEVASELDAILIGLPPTSLVSNSVVIESQGNVCEVQLKNISLIRNAIRQYYQLDPSKPILAQKSKFMPDFEKYKDKQLIAMEFPTLFRKTPKCSIPGLERDVWWDFNLNTICFVTSHRKKGKLCVYESGCDTALLDDHNTDSYCIQHIPNPITVAVTIVIQILNPDIQNRIFSSVFSYTTSNAQANEDQALDIFFQHYFTQNHARKYLGLNYKEVELRCITLNVKKFEDESEFQNYFSSQQVLKYIETQLQYSIPNQPSRRNVIFLPNQISILGLDIFVLKHLLEQNSFHIYLEKEEELKIKLHKQFQDANTGEEEAKEKTEIYLKNLKITSSIDFHHKESYASNSELKAYLSEINLCFGNCEFSTTHDKYYIYKIELEYDDKIDGVLFHFIATYIGLNEVPNSLTIESICHSNIDNDNTGFGLFIQSLLRRGITYTKTVKMLTIAYSKEDGYELEALYQLSHIIASLKIYTADVLVETSVNPADQVRAQEPDQSIASEQSQADSANPQNLPSTLIPLQNPQVEQTGHSDQAPANIPAIPRQTKRIFLNRKMKTLELNPNTMLRIKAIIRKEYDLELIESGLKHKYPTVEESILSKQFNSEIFAEIDVDSVPFDCPLTQLMVEKVLEQCQKTKPTTVSNCNGISIKLQSWKSMFYGDLTIKKEVVDGFLNLLSFKAKQSNKDIYLYPTVITQYLAENEMDTFSVMAKLEYGNVNVFDGEILYFPFFNYSNKSFNLVSVFPRARKIIGFGSISQTEQLVESVKDYLELEDARLMAAPNMTHSPRDFSYWEKELIDFSHVCLDATESDAGILCLLHALRSFRENIDDFILAGADIKYWRIYFAYILLEPLTFE